MSRYEKVLHDSELPMINRYAIVIDPTEVYLAWAKTCLDDKELILEGLHEESTVYLIPQVDDPDRWLRENFKPIFEEELRGWCTDETRWPEDLSFHTFKKFFEIRFCSVVMDMGKGSILRDDE